MHEYSHYYDKKYDLWPFRPKPKANIRSHNGAVKSGLLHSLSITRQQGILQPPLLLNLKTRESFHQALLQEKCPRKYISGYWLRWFNLPNCKTASKKVLEIDKNTSRLILFWRPRIVARPGPCTIEAQSRWAYAFTSNTLYCHDVTLIK